jgi:hypothetical protein
MSTTIQELTQIKTRIESMIRSYQAELDAINKAIELVQRERKDGQTVPIRGILPSRTTGREFAKLSLSDACRAAVPHNEFITPAEVRNAMLMGGFPEPTKGRGRLLNYVFVTLKRMASTGEFEKGLKDGKFAVRKPQAKETSYISETATLPLN